MNKSRFRKTNHQILLLIINATTDDFAHLCETRLLCLRNGNDTTDLKRYWLEFSKTAYIQGFCTMLGRKISTNLTKRQTWKVVLYIIQNTFYLGILLEHWQQCNNVGGKIM